MEELLIEKYAKAIRSTVFDIESAMDDHDFLGWTKNPLTVLFVNWIFVKSLECQNILLEGVDCNQQRVIGEYQMANEILDKFKELQS